MGWRDYAKQVQEGGHNRHNRHESPPDGPNVPIVPNVLGSPPRAPLDEGAAKARLREWHAHLSRVDEFASPPGWPLNGWLRVVDSSCWLYENFASEAVRQHWSALDLFGVMPAGPGNGGLADRMRDARNLKLSDGRAAWSSFGVPSRFCRGGSLDLPGIVLLWEVQGDDSRRA